MKASWVIGIIGLILINFGPVEPRMFMVPNQWLMEDMESVSSKLSQMKKVERAEVVQSSDIQPSDITFPKGKISAKGVHICRPVGTGEAQGHVPPNVSYLPTALHMVTLLGEYS